jgi:uncharacterized protein (DUF111 family)
MTRLLYVDAVAGVAGDMLLGALLDAGADEARVREGLRPLGVDVRVTRTERHGIGAARLEVVAEREHVHRDWAAVRELIDRAELPTRAHARAHDAFRRLAEAEGRIHGVPADEVHFHEVGAIDAVGEEEARRVVLDATAHYRRPDGSYRFENRFRYLIAQA